MTGDDHEEARRSWANHAALNPGNSGGAFRRHVTAIIDNAPRSATAIAKADCRLVPIDEKRFEFMIEERPFFGLHVMSILADRARRTNERATGS